MRCCSHCEDAGELFNREKAEDELRRYRESGVPNASTRLLLRALKSLDVQGKTLLDIGGGVGMIPFELFNEGFARATLAEAAPAYLEVARHEARRRGYAERIAFHHGDVVEIAPTLDAADLVTLDRVICCYPHMEQLVATSTAKAQRWYAVVYPKARWYLRWIKPLSDCYFWFRDSDFRIYLHRGVDAAIRGHGFQPFYQSGTLIWNVAVYERMNGVG